MDLKRAMLLRLARRNTELYPDDPVKREKVYNKYKVGGMCSLSRFIRTGLPHFCLFLFSDGCVSFSFSVCLSSSLRFQRRRQNGWD